MKDDTIDSIDAVLNSNNLREDIPMEQPEDPTGSDDIGPIMIASKQLMDSARLAGFTEDQAFQIARDFLMETFRMSIRNSQE